ncbi:MAG: YitT family protein [Candidatus Heteroscillospira sp.]
MNFPNRPVLTDIFCECLGSFLIALATYNIVLKAGFPMSGFSGLALIAHRFSGVPIGLATVLMNLPVAAVCWRLIGRKFMLRSLRCMVLSSLMVDYIAPMLPFYDGERILAAISAGVLLGFGFSLIYLRGSSTGGADFLILAAKALRPHLKLGSLVFGLDFFIVLAGGIIFRDADGLICGLILTYLTSVIIDRVLAGLNAGKLALIVTAHSREICAAVDSGSGRGSTVLPARGGYTWESREVVMTAGNARDMHQIEKAVKQTDPGAFMIILDSSEVHGYGFRVTRVAEPEIGP